MSEGPFRPSVIRLILISRGEVNISFETKNIELIGSTLAFRVLPIAVSFGVIPLFMGG
jgi:hypothetical protein